MTAIAEEEVVAFIRQNPGVFERHAELFAHLRLNSASDGRSVSLYERHLEVMRERYKKLEIKHAEMFRNARQNQSLVDNLMDWFARIVAERQLGSRADLLTEAISDQFEVTDVALRLWPVGEGVSKSWAKPVSEDQRVFAQGMMDPYVGENDGFSVANWFADPDVVKSMAIVALRTYPLPGQKRGRAFGLLLLGATDLHRFRADMGTYILRHLGILAGVALQDLTIDESSVSVLATG